MMRKVTDRACHPLLALGLLVALLAGCAGSPGPKSANVADDSPSAPGAGAAVNGGAKVEMLDAYGFQLTEVVRITSSVRADYQRALALLGPVGQQPEDLDRDRLKRGIAILETITSEAPDLTTPHIDLGVAYGRLGEIDKAEQSLGTALSLAPNHPVAHNELGILYRRTGRFDAARTSYERALSLHPGYHFALKNLGVLCDLYLQDLECALANYQLYADILPEEREVGIWIADLQNRLGVQDPLE